MSVALHHEIAGPPDAPVLLLGNSLGTSLAMWDDVLPALTPQLKVVRFDHRAQGASPEPPGPYDIADLGTDVVALLDELAVATASYCGVSIGGMVGLWLAANAPERIDRLVVSSTSAHLGGPEAWAERAATVRGAGTTAPIAGAVVARWLTTPFAAAHPEVAQRLHAQLLASPAEGYAACCGVLERLDLRPDLARIRRPTLVIAGEQDEAITPDHGRRIADGIGGARFELMSPGAHIPMAERPADVARLILDHLEVPA